MGSNQSHRKVYAKGFYDGVDSVRAVDLEGIEMNEARKLSLVKGLTGIARKVYEATPIGERWGIKRIAQELLRCGSSVDLAVVSGCLHSLTEQGLIKENKAEGTFSKEAEKAMKSEAKQPERLPATECSGHLAVALNLPRPERAKSPIEILTTISARFVVIKKDFDALVKGFDEAALSIEELFDEAEKRNEKLAQLQQLLKSLG